MVFRPSFQLFTDLDTSRAFGSINMDPTWRRKLSQDWSQLQQGQLNVSETLVEYGERITIVEEDIVEIKAEIVVINQRLDDVEAVAYMALMT